MPRSLLPRLSHLAFYLLLAYAAAITLPFVFNSTAIGLDPSWHFAMNHIVGSPYKYGPDIVFTYGPLGFVYWPEDVGGNLPISFAIRLLLWGLLIRELALGYSRSRSAPFPWFLAVLSIIVAQPALNYLFDEVVVGVALLMIIREHPETQKFWHLTIWLSILIAFAFLAKETGYLILMPGYTAYFFLTYWKERRKPSRASLLRFGCVAAAPFLGYLVYNPSLTGLWAYLTGAANMARGYGAAMSVPQPAGAYLSLEVFSVLLIAFAVYGWWRRWLGLEVIACVMLAFFEILKYSLVRQGPMFFYGFALVLFAILALKCGRTKTDSIVAGATWVALCTLTLIGFNPVWTSFSVERWNPIPHLSQIGKVLQWKKTMTGVDGQSEGNLFADALPKSLLARIQQAPVVVFPWELSYGPANHLNLIPLFTLQSYAAYTNWLDRATAEHLAKTPADTRLLMEWNSIDGRHPLLDVPATWESISSGFEGDLSTPGLLLLKKRALPTRIKYEAIRRAGSDLRQWQDVPDREHAVSASVEFSLTLGGRVRDLLYRIEPVYMDLETENGDFMRFRVIPDVLKAPFVINCLPLTKGGLESLVFKHVCEQKVKRFRFSGDGLESFSSAAEVSFFEAPDAHLPFAPKNAPELDSGIHDIRFGGQFRLRSARFAASDTRLELVWESLADQPLKYTVFVHLIDQEGKVLSQADHEQAPGAKAAPYLVKAGETWRDVIPLSASQLKGVTRIAFGLWDPPGTFLTADQGERDWENRRLLVPVPMELRRLAAPSTAPHTGSGVNFGDELSLGGYTIRDKNGHTEVELHWNALHKPSADYSLFVHALDNTGAIAFQRDHFLMNAAGSSTSAWAAGDSVEDRFFLTPPSKYPPGAYTLRIGVWDPVTSKFLQVLESNLSEPADAWRGRALVIENAPCR